MRNHKGLDSSIVGHEDVVSSALTMTTYDFLMAIATVFSPPRIDERKRVYSPRDAYGKNHQKARKPYTTRGC